jgi:DnaK suppressor protein
MFDARYTQLKRLLEDRKRELQRSLSTRLRDVRTDRGYDGKLVGALDAVEVSDSDLQQEIGVVMAEMIADVLRRVDEALARLENGVYGSCVDCNGEIPDKRLKALPFALRCRECEELREIDERRTRRFPVGRDISMLQFDADGRE